MLYLNNEKFNDVKMRVERLYRRYRNYEGLTIGQVASKILDDLDSRFQDDPVTEVAAYAILADLYKDDSRVLNYLRLEFENWKAYFDFTQEDLDANNIQVVDFLGQRLRLGKVAM